MNTNSPAASPTPGTPIDSAMNRLARLVNPMATHGRQQALVTLASSIVAVLLAFVISGVLMLITGENPVTAFAKMLDTGLQTDYLLESLDRATPFIIAALAVAVGFKMNLFNIGVEGQFLVGMFWAAVIGARVNLPGVLQIIFCCLVAIVAASAWAGIAAYLKVKRNVHEVISTIMLNSIALGLLDWLFNEFFRDDTGTGTLDVRTKKLPESANLPSLFDSRLTSFIFVALALCVLYWLLVYKSRFGFRLRASGHNATAAQTAGISANRMIVSAMLLSGALAGLAGLPWLLGTGHSYGPARPDGYGFTGIAVALLGRNGPVGIVVAAFLYGFLDAVAGPLQLEGIPKSIVTVIQGITLLTVVIVNEAANRWYSRRTTERAAKALADAETIGAAA